MPVINQFRKLTLQMCEPLVLSHHYSKRMPSAIKLCYGWVSKREVQACCIFSVATGRWETENLWELTRLVRLPEYDKPLTKLISQALGHIRKHKLTNLVVSFADVEEDHHGGIYQACSWVYNGATDKRLDGFNIDGLFVPARTCNQKYGTSSVDGLKKLLPKSKVEPHFDCEKHHYWKAINKEGMQQAIRMGLRSQPYPKPMIEHGSDKNTSVDPQLRKGKIEIGKVEETNEGKERRAIELGKDVVQG